MTGNDRREPPLRALDLLATLTQHRVDFVVIGGYSLAAHGYVRGTKDVDIVPEPSRPNLERLLEALEAMEAGHLAAGDFEPDELPELTLDNFEEGGNWPLRTRFGRLDVTQYVEGARSYDQLRDGAVIPELPGFEHSPRFAGYDDLIALHETAVPRHPPRTAGPAASGARS